MKICKKELCTGCSNCVNICFKNAITMCKDEYGFFYPIINFEKCVNCNACQNVCPNNNELKSNVSFKAYASWHLSEDIRKSSASGGVASAIYQKVISNNGVGYGVSFDDNLFLTYKRMISLRDIKKIRGSKYVFSNMKSIVKDIKNDLFNNKTVVFIGLPCQVAAVKSFLKHEYANLLLIDIICHGVPSNDFLIEHVNHLTSKKADNIVFRNDNEFIFQIFKDNKLIKKKSGEKDFYITGFKDGLFYRESCYNCSYAKNERISDITIGDFWGLGVLEPFNHPYEGSISLILTNTKKGEYFIHECEDILFLEERKVQEALLGNLQLNHPTVKHNLYDVFMNNYQDKGFELSAKKTLKRKVVNQTIGYYKKCFLSKIKGFIKRVIERRSF